MPVSSALCQNSHGLSCAGCCGIYNFKSHKKSDVKDVLQENTQLVHNLLTLYGDNPHRLLQYSYLRRSQFLKTQLVAAIRICPFVGFLDSEMNRVGCLLHAEQLGRDARSLGVHSWRMCRDHLCAAHEWFNEDDREILLKCNISWYAYGLLIAEPDYYFAFIDNVEKKSATSWYRLQWSQQAIECLSDYFSILDESPISQDTIHIGSQIIYEDTMVHAVSWYSQNFSLSSKWHKVFPILGIALDDASLVQYTESRLNAILSDFLRFSENSEKNK